MPASVMYKWALCAVLVFCTLQTTFATNPYIAPVSRLDDFYKTCVADCRRQFGRLRKNVVFPGVPTEKDIRRFKAKEAKDDDIGFNLRSLTIIPDESPAVDPSPLAVQGPNSAKGKTRKSRKRRKRFSKALRKNPIKRKQLRKRIKQECRDYCRPSVTIGYFCYCNATICIPDLGFRCLCTKHICVKE